jgi:hypothetical protein
MDRLPFALTTILQAFQPLMRSEVFTSFCYLLSAALDRAGDPRSVGTGTSGSLRAGAL